MNFFTAFTGILTKEAAPSQGFEPVTSSIAATSADSKPKVHASTSYSAGNCYQNLALLSYQNRYKVGGIKITVPLSRVYDEMDPISSDFVSVKSLKVILLGKE